MASMPIHKYRPFQPVHLPGRTWPSRTIERATTLVQCVDLRDGNQASSSRWRAAQAEDVRPARQDGDQGDRSRLSVGVEDRLRVCAQLVEKDTDPPDTTIAVLTQCAARADRAHLRGVEGREAGNRAPLQLDLRDAAPRRLPARESGDHRASPCAAPGTSAELADRPYEHGDRVRVLPESFHGTELDYALEICEAVMPMWGPTNSEKMIVNLPTTVEMFAAQRLRRPARVVPRQVSGARSDHPLSVHPHNDRGTGVAAAELGLDGGRGSRRGDAVRERRADRNVDLVTLALNLLTQGVDPRLDLPGSTRR